MNAVYPLIEIILADIPDVCLHLRGAADELTLRDGDPAAGSLQRHGLVEAGEVARQRGPAPRCGASRILVVHGPEETLHAPGHDDLPALVVDDGVGKVAGEGDSATGYTAFYGAPQGSAAHHKGTAARISLCSGPFPGEKGLALEVAVILLEQLHPDILHDALEHLFCVYTAHNNYV